MERKTENKTNNAPEESTKKPQVYKVVCGTFKTRNEALQRAAEVRKAGVNVSLTIMKTEYNLLYKEGMTKAEAEEAKKVIEAKKVNAKVSEQ